MLALLVALARAALGRFDRWLVGSPAPYAVPPARPEPRRQSIPAAPVTCPRRWADERGLHLSPGGEA